MSPAGNVSRNIGTNWQSPTRPSAKGVRTMLPHVDELRPIHNLDSMSELVRALSGAAAKGYDPKALLRQVA